MNERLLIGILVLVFIFIAISVLLIKLVGIFAIPLIIVMGVFGIAGWHHGGKDDNYKG